MVSYKDILHFWFEELSSEDHFTKSDTLDNEIRDRFLSIFEAAHAGECADWRQTAKGRLAEIIVLDQFSRNMFRDTPRAFSADPLALALAQHLVESPEFDQLSTDEKHFALMPFMHSESKKIHETAWKLFKKLGKKTAFEYEIRHKEIIDRFGRYPHRNEIL